MEPVELVNSCDLEKLPSGPRVLAQLLAAARRPDIHIGELAELFRADPALTVRVVAACNTPVFSRGGRISDIKDAVFHLGLAEVSKIVQMVMLTDFRKYPTHLYTHSAEYFWQRSLHTALVIDEISDHDPQAYTAGIMHLVGVWALCSVFPLGHASICEGEMEMQAQLEQLRLGVTYCGAGGRSMARWGFPAIICEAVAWQLAPSALADPAHRELARMLKRAVAITDWHYGARNEQNLIRSDLTITDVEECNARAAEKVARIGFGF